MKLKIVYKNLFDAAKKRGISRGAAGLIIDRVNRHEYGDYCHRLAIANGDKLLLKSLK